MDLWKDKQNKSALLETDYKRKSEIRNKKGDITDMEEMKRFIKRSTSDPYGDTFETLEKGKISYYHNSHNLTQEVENLSRPILNKRDWKSD